MTSLVEFQGFRAGRHCGYCSSDYKFTHGMWAHEMTTQAYQDLIDRNWRRSGCYCYKPVMNQTCCPSYMIRCDAVTFMPSKHQKKLIKRVNRFLMTGEINIPNSSDELEQSHEKEAESVGAGSRTPPSTSLGPDPSKPRCLKAKEIRRMRKQEKLAARGELDTKCYGDDAGNQKNKEKSLEELLAGYRIADAKHKLQLRLVRSQPCEFVDAEYEVYKRYQMAVHKDAEADLSKDRFASFLVQTPLIYERKDGVDLGSFHYQYWLDKQLIAVEVMDVLPYCISSKYFFYDPSFSFLDLGTYSALRAIELVNSFHKKLPSLAYYLMGYYIHTCPKMRYKARFNSSYLLCPETYAWIPVELCVPKLIKHKYSRLTDDIQAEDRDKPVSGTLKQVLCLYGGKVMPYGKVKQLCRRDMDSEVNLYASLVGDKLARTMLLYRPE